MTGFAFFSVSELKEAYFICNFQVFEEKAYLVGVERKGDGEWLFDIEESLEELEQLADTAGLAVVGSTYQKLVFSSFLMYLLRMRLDSWSPVIYCGC